MLTTVLRLGPTFNSSLRRCAFAAAVHLSPLVVCNWTKEEKEMVIIRGQIANKFSTMSWSINNIVMFHFNIYYV